MDVFVLWALFCSPTEEDNQVPAGSGGGVNFSGQGPHEVSLGAATPLRVPPHGGGVPFAAGRQVYLEVSRAPGVASSLRHRLLWVFSS